MKADILEEALEGMRLEWPGWRTSDVWLISPEDVSAGSHVFPDVQSRLDQRIARRSLITPLQATQKPATVRRILAAYLDSSAANIRFGVKTDGKPFLLDAPRLDFNLSHSGRFMVLAVTQANAVGADIELIGVRGRDALAERILGSVAGKTYKNLNLDRQAAAFCFAWSEREAYCKMLGLGIGNGWSSMIETFANVPLLMPPRQGASRKISGHTFYYLNLVRGLSFSICTEHELVRLNVHWLCPAATYPTRLQQTPLIRSVMVETPNVSHVHLIRQKSERRCAERLIFTVGVAACVFHDKLDQLSGLS